MDTLRLYVVSYHGDLWKEREILYKEVLPDLRAWCENKRIQLIETDVRWGGYMKVERILDIRRQIQDSYFNGEMPFFINLTSDSLGLVPMWGEATETITQEIHRKLHLSEPEINILYGSYREDNPNTLFLVRNDSFLDTLTTKENAFFLKKNLLSRGQSQTCQRLMAKYSESQLFFYGYNEVYLQEDDLKINVELDKDVFQKVLEYIQSRVQQQRPARPPAVNVYDQIQDAHDTFSRSYGAKVRGREPVIQQLEDYIRTGGKDTPLLLLGGAGSGKSSIMAKAAQQFAAGGYLDKYQAGDDCAPWLVFYHFVGAVPGSTELYMMLKRLLRDIRLTMDTTMPHDVDAAAQMCCSALSNGTSRPLLVIVDAVNQFDDEPSSQILSWVPRKLAPNVRCVISMINDSIQHKKLMSRETTPQELHLVPLQSSTRKQIVTEMLSQYSHSLNADQMNCLMTKKGSENPLWLSVAAEELRVIQDPVMFDKYTHDIPENLVDLLESVLSRLEADQGELLVATLCLLETSVSGLLESELRTLLGAKHNTVAPSPYEEKEELESSEKDLGKQKQSEEPLLESRWLEIYRVLRPYLRPYGDSREGRLDFYHRSFSKAVRSRYFKVGHENENCEESFDIYKVWHQRLADFFEHSDNVNRKTEEYLYHLCEIEDSYRLSQCLCDWTMLQRLYHEEYSSRLINYWRKAGGMDTMVRCYTEALTELETMEPRDDELVACRYELLARVYLQAGRYSDSLNLAETVKNWEEKELGNRPERMVDLHSLMAEIYEEKLKLNDFVSPTQLPDLRKTIMYARKSINIRNTLTGEHHKLKLAMSLMKLAFSLESWNACGGDVTEMSGEEAIREGNQHIDSAIEIFQELGDAGHYAEALMTKGVLAPRGSMEQLKYYNEAMEICRQVYGEESLLSSRLYINIGIVYEDNSDYVKAYEFFKRWADVSEAVLGPDHPKTVRAKGVLREPKYRLVALRIKQHLDRNNQSEDEEAELDEVQINEEVEHLAEEEDGYRSDDDNEDEEEGERDGRHRETDNQTQTQRQQILDASDFMQRILNDIWQQMSDIQEAQSSGSNNENNAENVQPVIEVPPSRSVLVRSNPMRLVRDSGALDEASTDNRGTSSDTNRSEDSVDSNILEEADSSLEEDAENQYSDDTNRQTGSTSVLLDGAGTNLSDNRVGLAGGGATAFCNRQEESQATPPGGSGCMDSNRLEESDPGAALEDNVSNLRIQDLCNRLRGFMDLESNGAEGSTTEAMASRLRDRIFGTIDNRLQEISECLDMDNREQDNRDRDDSPNS